MIFIFAAGLLFAVVAWAAARFARTAAPGPDVLVGCVSLLFILSAPFIIQLIRRYILPTLPSNTVEFFIIHALIYTPLVGATYTWLLRDAAGLAVAFGSTLVSIAVMIVTDLLKLGGVFLPQLVGGVAWLATTSIGLALVAARIRYRTHLLCYGCAYELRGARKPRCPECGKRISSQQFRSILREQESDSRTETVT